MARTIFRVRQAEIAFYLLEASGGVGKRRFKLFRTSCGGKVKDGWVPVNSTTLAQLESLNEDFARFEACLLHFNSKKPHAYTAQPSIRGPAGAWEGEAFVARVSLRHESGKQQKVMPGDRDGA